MMIDDDEVVSHQLSAVLHDGVMWWYRGSRSGETGGEVGYQGFFHMSCSIQGGEGAGR